VAGTKVPPGALIAHLQRALNFVQAELSVLDVSTRVVVHGIVGHAEVQVILFIVTRARIEFFVTSAGISSTTFLFSFSRSYFLPLDQNGRLATSEEMASFEGLTLIESVQPEVSSFDE
jgi:hypothetical protein